MSTADHCRAMAEEADRLASIVSYTRDKIRLAEQARSWRDRATALETAPAALAPVRPGGSFLRSWLRNRRA